MKRSIEAIVGCLVAAQRLAAAVFMIAMTGLYGFNVLARTFLPTLSGSLAWIDDAARYLMIWVVFLAIGPALESGRHIVVDLAWRRLGRPARTLMFRLIDVTGILFSGWMAILSVQLAMFIAETGQISPTLQLPVYVLYIAPIVGFASLTMIFFLRLFGYFDRRQAMLDAEQTGQQLS
jgi:TRAP-type C4-dicarboxylate transport system permease small subunit